MTDVNSAQQIITDALVLGGVISDDEQPSAAQAQRGLNLLSDLLDSWSADRITVYTTQEYSFPFTSAQTYTVGPDGTFNMAFTPLKVEDMYCGVTTTNPESEVPIRIVGAQEWGQITVKTTTSPIPRTCWIDYQWPLCNFSFFPIPTGANTCNFYAWQELSSAANLTSDLIFPPGYKLALKFNLAEYLCPFFGRKVPEDVAKNAMKSKAIITSRNLPEDHVMQCDLGTLSPSKTFNWLTGEAR